MNLEFINSIIKIFSIEFITFVISYKSIGLKFKDTSIIHKILLIIGISISSLIYVIIRNYIYVLESVIIVIFFNTFLFLKLNNKKIRESFFIIFVSNAISYLISILLFPIVFIINSWLNINNSIIMFSELGIISYIFVFVFFKFKKFKNGINILSSKIIKDYIEIIFIVIAVVIIILYGVLNILNSTVIYRVYIYGFIIGGLIVILIQKTLKLSYKQKMLENTLKDYESEIKEKEKKIKKIEDEKFRISKLNHEFYNRQKSLELKVEEALKNLQYETGLENDLKDKIKELSNEYNDKLKQNKKNEILPKTDIDDIDDMFKYMQSECIKNNIEFILQVNGNIHYFINNVINKTEFVTLIGDHIRDAIIAINSSKNKFRSILVILGIKNNVYELDIYDSGIKFEKEVFEKLGKEPITTHKDEGGTGIGFITTFETLKQCNGSLIIEELDENTGNNYTKVLKFIFDNKNEFKVIFSK